MGADYNFLVCDLHTFKRKFSSYNEFKGKLELEYEEEYFDLPIPSQNEGIFKSYPRIFELEVSKYSTGAGHFYEALTYLSGSNNENLTICNTFFAHMFWDWFYLSNEVDFLFYPTLDDLNYFGRNEERHLSSLSANSLNKIVKLKNQIQWGKLKEISKEIAVEDLIYISTWKEFESQIQLWLDLYEFCLRNKAGIVFWKK